MFVKENPDRKKKIKKLGQLRIIEYVQSQQIVKMSNMESFARIVNKQQLY